MSSIVDTTAGKIEGFERGGLKIFRGIPYAAPPVGERRWLPPQPVGSWTGVRQAHSFGPIAPQTRTMKALEGVISVFDTAAPESEDCLYLNITTPDLDSARRPVMVWIHGGAFTTGAGSLPMYDGSTLAKRGDVVIVTINYRLGPFGFLNLNEITEARIPATGNEGLMDQVAALAWVHDNIAAFGGDPGDVTIFGESAGGMAVSALLGMPRARGLFHKAIAQSGASQVQCLDRAATIAGEFVGELGLKTGDVDGLRSVGVAQCLSAMVEISARHPEGMVCQPVTDGNVLPELPIKTIDKGSADGVIVMAGFCLDEWKLFALMDRRAATMDEAFLMRRLCRRFSPEDARTLIEGYRTARLRRGEPVSPQELFSAIQTGLLFHLPTIRLLETLNRRNQSAHAYIFAWPSPYQDGLLGACHGIDIGFLFGTHALSEVTKAFNGSGPAADALSMKVQDAWLAFARTGDPSCDSLGRWPSYGQRRETMLIGKDCALVEAPYEEERQVWDSLPGVRVLN